MLTRPLQQASAKKWIRFPLLDDASSEVISALGVSKVAVGSLYALLLGECDVGK